MARGRGPLGTGSEEGLLSPCITSATIRLRVRLYDHECGQPTNAAVPGCPRAFLYRFAGRGSLPSVDRQTGKHGRRVHIFPAHAARCAATKITAPCGCKPAGGANGAPSGLHDREPASSDPSESLDSRGTRKPKRARREPPGDLEPAGLRAKLDELVRRAGPPPGRLPVVVRRYNQNSSEAVQIVFMGEGSTMHRVWVHLHELLRLPGLLEHLCGGRSFVEAKNSPDGIVTSIADGDAADKFKLRIKVGARSRAAALPPTPTPNPNQRTCCCSALAAGSAALAAGPALLPVAPHWLLAPRQPTPAPPPPPGAPRPRSTRCRRRCGAWA